MYIHNIIKKEITHQMWHNHPFSQKKPRQQKEQGVGQNLKKGVGNRGRVFMKKGFRNPLPATMKQLQEISYSSYDLNMKKMHCYISYL